MLGVYSHLQRKERVSSINLRFSSFLRGGRLPPLRDGTESESSVSVELSSISGFPREGFGCCLGASKGGTGADESGRCRWR